MAEKITISTDEVNSADVDAKLRERGNDPYAPPSADQVGGIKWTQILYNTLVYSTLFGLVGGVAAGVLGEMYWLAMPKTLEGYVRYQQANDLRDWRRAHGSGRCDRRNT